MIYERIAYMCPLGELTMVSDGKALTALSFQGEKYEAAVVEESQTDRKAAAMEEAKRLDRTVVDIEEFLMDNQTAGASEKRVHMVQKKGNTVRKRGRNAGWIQRK